MSDSTNYLKTLRALFPIYGPYEKRFFSDFKNNIDEFITFHPHPCREDLEDNFGPPTAVISEYLASINTDYLARQLSRTKFIRITCLSILCTLIIGLGIFTAFNYKSYLDFQDALPAIREITIETND